MTIQTKNKIIEDMNKLYTQDKNIDNAFFELEKLGINVLNFAPNVDFENSKSKVSNFKITTSYQFKLNEKIFYRKNNIIDMTYNFNKNVITIEDLKLENEMDLDKNKIQNTIYFSKNDKNSWIRKLENDINTNIRIFDKIVNEATKQIIHILEEKYLAKKIQGKNKIDTILKNIINHSKTRQVAQTKDFVERKIKVVIQGRIRKHIRKMEKKERNFFITLLSDKMSYEDFFKHFEDMDRMLDDKEDMILFKKEIFTYINSVVEATYYDLLQENYQIQSKFNLENNIEEDLENNDILLVNRKQLMKETLKRLLPIFNKHGQDIKDYEF